MMNAPDDSDTVAQAPAKPRGHDRRQRHWCSLAHSMFRHRRRGHRRHHDANRHSYVDWHEPWLLALAIGIAFLCVTDAYLTLLILDRGGEEVNPVMRWLLDHDSQVFLLVKLALTAVCVAFVIAHKRFRLWSRFSGYQILWTVFFAYVGLISYQIGLLSA